MTCRQLSTYNGANGSGQPGGGGYATEAECLEACKEGACCEGATCSVKPQCQCQGTGKTFKGVGTTCSPSPCGVCLGTQPSIPGCDPFAGAPSIASHPCSTPTGGACGGEPAVQIAGAQCDQGSLQCDYGVCCKFCDGQTGSVTDAQTQGGKYLCLFAGQTSQYLVQCNAQKGTWIVCGQNGSSRAGQYSCLRSDPWEFNPLP